MSNFEKQGEMPAKQITVQIHLNVDRDGNVVAAPIPDGEKIVIDRDAVRASARGCVKLSDGELLVKQIHDAMFHRSMTKVELSKKLKVSPKALWGYFKTPGRVSLAMMMRICKAAGIQQVTLNTAGTYFEK